MRVQAAGFGLLLCLAMTVPALDGPDYSTVHLRDGSTLTGQVESLGNGTLILRISLTDRRAIPATEIAMIDRRSGAAGLSDPELFDARRRSHLLLLADGANVTGRLLAIRGDASAARSLTYIFRTFDGVERRFTEADVARAYLGSYDSRLIAARAKAGADAKSARGNPESRAPASSAPTPVNSLALR